MPCFFFLGQIHIFCQQKWVVDVQSLILRVMTSVLLFFFFFVRRLTTVVLQVPHYDVHGVNEIHGQHFRHHPPGAKAKENPNREPTPPVREQIDDNPAMVTVQQ